MKNHTYKRLVVVLFFTFIFISTISMNVLAAEEQEIRVVKIKIATQQPTNNEAEVTIEESIENNQVDAFDKLSANEQYFFAECVELEACGGGLKSKQAVASAIVNRVNSDKFPNSFEGVVSQKDNGTYQFSTYAKGWGSKTITEETYEACRNAINGGDLVDGATYFANLNICKGSWFHSAESAGTLVRTVEIGGHTFFKLAN